LWKTVCDDVPSLHLRIVEILSEIEKYDAQTNKKSLP
jgi:hypothetical protein